jgi:co-chaperonin GroES (HSP10)
MLKGAVLHDHVLVEIQKSEWATADVVGEHEDPKAGSGIVVAVPDKEDILFFSNYSWILEQSMLNESMAEKLHAKMSALIGKKVYFEKRADLGNTIEDGSKTYATIKFSKLIYVEEQ